MTEDEEERSRAAQWTEAHENSAQRVMEHRSGGRFLFLSSSAWIAIGIVVAVSLWLGSGVFNNLLSVEPSPRAEAKPVHVRVARLVAEDKANQLLVKGRTQGFLDVLVRAETAGLVEAVGAEKGAAVKEGNLILKLSPNDRKAKLAEAKALVAQRQSQYNASVELARRGFTSKIKVKEDLASLNAARSTLKLAQMEVARTVIAAPFEGILMDRLMEVGDYVKVGDAVARVVSLSPVKVVGEVTERDVGGLVLGTEGTVSLLDGRSFKGPLTYISPAADPVSRTFRIELHVMDWQGGAADGMTAEMRIPLETVRAFKVSPAVLTLDDTGVVGVKTVGPDNVVGFTPVRIIADGPEGMWIAGLPDEITLITVGQAFVRAGQVVVPQFQGEEGNVAH